MVIFLLLSKCLLCTLLTPITSWTLHKNLIHQFDQPWTNLGDELNTLNQMKEGNGWGEWAERNGWGDVLARGVRGGEALEEEEE